MLHLTRHMGPFQWLAETATIIEYYNYIPASSYPAKQRAKLLRKHFNNWQLHFKIITVDDDRYMLSAVLNRRFASFIQKQNCVATRIWFDWLIMLIIIIIYVRFKQFEGEVD